MTGGPSPFFSDRSGFDHIGRLRHGWRHLIGDLEGSRVRLGKNGWRFLLVCFYEGVDDERQVEQFRWEAFAVVQEGVEEGGY